jgi:hypothetical protein
MEDDEDYLKRVQSLVNAVMQSDQEALEAFHSDRKRRNDFWSILKKLRDEYQSENAQFDAYEFEEWITDKYGIQLNFVEGNIGGDYQIVDEQKYIVYLLKFQ